MMPVNPQLVLEELVAVFAGGPPVGEKQLLEEISRASRVVCVGAGRVGLSMASFAKRLAHLGLQSYWINDVTLTKFQPGDLMLIGSGSGETETSVTMGRLAKQFGLRLGLITTSESSRLAELADFLLVLDCPSKTGVNSRVKTSQPMTSLFEQATLVYLDSVVLELINLMCIPEDAMKERHNNLE